MEEDDGIQSLLSHSHSHTHRSRSESGSDGGGSGDTGNSNSNIGIAACVGELATLATPTTAATTTTTTTPIRQPDGDPPDLPDELYLEIFKFLKLADLMTVAHTCSLWRRLAGDWELFAGAFTTLYPSVEDTAAVVLHRDVIEPSGLSWIAHVSRWADTSELGGHERLSSLWKRGETYYDADGRLRVSVRGSAFILGADVDAHGFNVYFFASPAAGDRPEESRGVVKFVGKHRLSTDYWLTEWMEPEWRGYIRPVIYTPRAIATVWALALAFIASGVGALLCTGLPAWVGGAVVAVAVSVVSVHVGIRVVKELDFASLSKSTKGEVVGVLALLAVLCLYVWLGVGALVVQPLAFGFVVVTTLASPVVVVAAIWWTLLSLKHARTHTAPRVSLVHRGVTSAAVIGVMLVAGSSWYSKKSSGLFFALCALCVSVYVYSTLHFYAHTVYGAPSPGRKHNDDFYVIDRMYYVVPFLTVPVIAVLVLVGAALVEHAAAHPACFGVPAYEGSPTEQPATSTVDGVEQSCPACPATKSVGLVLLSLAAFVAGAVPLYRCYGDYSHRYLVYGETANIRLPMFVDSDNFYWGDSVFTRAFQDPREMAFALYGAGTHSVFGTPIIRRVVQHS